MAIRNIVNEINLYTDALYPLIYIHTFEETKAMNIIKKVSGGRDIWCYEYGKGIVDLKTGDTIVDGSGIKYVLNSLMGREDFDDKTLVIKDVHYHLQTTAGGMVLDPAVPIYLKKLANKIFNGLNCTVFLMSPKLTIPFELEKYIAVFEMELLEYEDIKDLVKEFIKVNGIKEIDEDLLDELSNALKGLSEFEIVNLLSLAYSQDGYIKKTDLNLILKEKFQVVKKSGVLEIIELKNKFSDIGGLENLKFWLHNKARIIKNLNNALEYGVDIPSGVLVVGMPGCGKSLTAKATAHLFEVPLLRLDIGKLLGRYVGDSEENMRKAFKLAEAISPCVLWIDEIEKAFSGVGGGSGGAGTGSGEVITRLFGYFLTWLQEKTGTTFVIATANDITSFPPELLRKGRFDEIFFVDFPNETEREKIFEIHIKKRREQDYKNINISNLAEKTKGFSGADIEGVVKESVETAFLQDKDGITTEDLMRKLEITTPSAVTLKEKIEQVRDVLSGHQFKNASLE